MYINNANTVHDKLSNNLHDSTANVNNAQVKHHVSTSENVELGCVPIGTGNDFVRNFGQNEFFSDITKQDLMALGLSGGSNAGEKRKALLKKLNLPEHMSANAMLQALNLLYTREELEQMLNESGIERD